MIKPIPKYQNYFFTSGTKKIYGLTEKGGINRIDVIDQDGDTAVLIDFFSKNGELFFCIQEIQPNDEQSENEDIKNIFYKQDTNGKIQELVFSPEKKIQGPVEFENGEFSIKNFDYQGTPCSDVKNETFENVGIERFLLVNGLSYFAGDGLFFNIAEGRPNVRKPGLAFWPVNSKSYKYIKLPKGEIW